jgi:hypothetical protein
VEPEEPEGAPELPECDPLFPWLPVLGLFFSLPIPLPMLPVSFPELGLLPMPLPVFPLPLPELPLPMLPPDPLPVPELPPEAWANRGKLDAAYATLLSPTTSTPAENTCINYIATSLD